MGCNGGKELVCDRLLIRVQVCVVFLIKKTTKTNEITFSTDVYFFESKERKLASVHLIGAWI